MRLVFPFCEKDKHLAIRVLKWAAVLDERIESPVLLCYDNSTDAGEVLQIAHELFEKVETFTYPTPQPFPWPRLQNRVFQACARHIETLSPMPWFWWEPDLTPLKSGWYKSISEAHAKGGRLFSGHVVSHVIPTGHMTGCGVYPHDLPRRSDRAMMADKAAWDVNMAKDMIRKCNPINRLLHHQYFDDDTGACPTFPTLAALKRIPESAVTFHRCKDSSLIDRLIELRTPGFVEKMLKSIFEIRDSAVMVYLPPPSVADVSVFLDNLKQNPPSIPLITISDHPYPGAMLIPEPHKSVTGKDKIASFIFLEAMQIAKRHEIKRVVWLEIDCRMHGQGWDRSLLKSLGTNGAVASGHLAVCCPEFGDRRFKSELATLSRKFKNKILVHHDYKIGMPVPFINGAPAAYSVDAVLELFPDGQLEEVERMLTQDRDIGERYAKKHGALAALRAQKHCPAVLASGERVFSLPQFQSFCQSNGVCVHPVKYRWNPTIARRFYHSGDLGDIIYALKAIQLAGGGQLFLGPDYRSKLAIHTPMKEPVFRLLEPLLKKQSYLKSVGFSAAVPADCTDLNMFRETTLSKYKNLCLSQCALIGLESIFNSNPWLLAGARRLAKIVVARSFRYRSRDFQWKQLVDRFSKDMLFIGHQSEHRDFCRLFGYVPTIRIRDFLDMAEVINGADWFIGNQSFPCSIAIGLGKHVLQEAHYEKADGTEVFPDCLFERPYFYTQRDNPESIPWS